MRKTLLPIVLFTLASCAPIEEGEVINHAANDDKELIVLAAPPDGDDYYAGVRSDIYDFHIAYARQIASRDHVLILSGADDYESYVEELGADKVLNVEMHLPCPLTSHLALALLRPHFACYSNQQKTNGHAS